MKTIEDVLKKSGNAFYFVTPDSSAASALRLMADEQVGVLPVYESGALVGFICDYDCITSALLGGRSIKELRVSEIMTHNFTNVSAGQTLEECLAIMTENKIQYLPVFVDASYKGFVSMSNLYKTLIDDQRAYIYRLENYILGFDYGR